MPETPQRDADRRRFEELLPFYLTGSLDDEQHRFVVGYLARHPEAKDAMRFAQSMQSVVRGTTSPTDGEAAWQLFQARRDAEERPRGWQRLQAWFADMGLSPALAAALAVIVIQATVAGVHLVSDHRHARTVDVAAIRSLQPHARLVVPNDVDAEPLLATIHSHEAQVVRSTQADPRTGFYEVYIVIEDPSRLDHLLRSLSDKGLTHKAETL